MYPTTMLSLASDPCSSSVRKSQEERPAQEYTNCALSIVSIGKWEQLNSVPLCYGARGDSYGEFTFTEAGFIIKLNFTHINGSLSCSCIHGVGLNSTSLSFEPFDIPLAVAVNDIFQIWFSQDYMDCVEENNSGEMCVDVHALYT